MKNKKKSTEQSYEKEEEKNSRRRKKNRLGGRRMKILYSTLHLMSSFLCKKWTQIKLFLKKKTSL